MGKMIAAILAGGKGTGMDIFCQVRPKPALPFAGKYRFIDFCLSNCLHSKVADVAVLVTTGVANWLIILIVAKWQLREYQHCGAGTNE